MQRLLIGVLLLLVLFFAAANARLLDRERILEAKLAAQETRKAKPSRTVQAPVPTEPAFAKPEVAPPPVHPAAEPKVEAKSALQITPLDRAEKLVTSVFKDVKGFADTVGQRWVLYNSVHKMKVPGDERLGLSESQKQIIDDLRNRRDLQTQVFKDQIQKIEDQTELSIRQVLSPDQLKKYDGGGQESAQLAAQTILQPQGELLASGVRPGFLGVQTGDSKDGGVAVSDVTKGSAASAIGLQAGDVILELNGGTVANFQELAAKIHDAGEGATVMLKIRRDGSEFYQSGQLGGRGK
jgi:hypothetical protein